MSQLISRISALLETQQPKPDFLVRPDVSKQPPTIASIPPNGEENHGYYDSLAQDYNNEIAKRNEQDMLWKAVNNPKMSDKDKSIIINEVVMKSMYLMGSDYRKKLAEKAYPSYGGQGSAISCPSDIHKGPFMNSDDVYTFIYGEETEKNIKDNCNEKLFKLINNTEVSEGMALRSQGHKWLNGIILYNAHSIVIRDPDNNFGQPGFLRAYYYADRLSIEVLNRYIVPELIKAVNDNLINEKNGYEKAVDIINNTYKSVYAEKTDMLNQPNIDHINEKTLFSDAPMTQKLRKAVSEQEGIKELRKSCDDKDIKIDRLEKRVDALSTMLEMVMRKLNTMEEMYLDLSIQHNTTQ